MAKKYSRKQRGGTYLFGAAITPGTVNNYGQEVIAGPKLIPDCLAAVKPDTMGFSGHKGLPGMGGGGKRRRSRKQSGGRYGFVSAAGAPPAGGPALGGPAPMQAIGLERAVANPYNPQAGGGALTGAPVGGDNQAYFAPTAGYGNQASSWVGSTGSPAMVQIPYEARAMNPACLKTGGGRRRSRRNHRNRRSRRSTRR